MDQVMLMKIGSAARGDLLVRYKSRLQSGQSAIRERYLADADAPRLLHERSQLIDELLRELWKELCFPDSLALVAVGGYGRGELYGLDHDPQRMQQDWLQPRTRIKGLWLTGQDVMSCGVAGAMMGGMASAAAIAGPRKMVPVLKGIFG
jgi:phytoene dehydrogenase-like protein